ncbi:YdcF family protein [Flectobacillus roseus]|uniref:YdcF family protein n=1 Tax=Flectobacillus roseus TaxID=502259 RepID=UPI0024B6E0EE|nr:YdcF family protein [Flectobacillus roseus]MDI9872672.1 YdcF family protein [Flectobacillus roseus]
MFFILSKLLFYIFMPISLITITLIWGIITKSLRLKKILLCTSLGILLLLGNSTIVNWGYHLWETPPPTSPFAQRYDVGIIISGGMMMNRECNREQIFSGKTADRFLQPLRMYKRGLLKKIIISGGDVSINPLNNEHDSETAKTQQILIELGVKPEDILLETKARNTRENALYCAQILHNFPQLKTSVLFTSAFHGRRAIGCFQKAGLNTTLYSCAIRAVDMGYTPDTLVIPSEQALAEAYQLIHEIIGYCVYKAMGYC